MLKITSAAICILMSGTTTLAVAVDPFTAKPDGVTFTSGGANADAKKGMRGMAQNFNLRMQFAAAGSSSALSDVNVKVEDSKGTTKLDTTSKGPCFFANLPGGTYRVTADYKGTSEVKTIRVGAKQAAAVRFYLPTDQAVAGQGPVRCWK
jgi:hypothetical protein